jgi:hypothetical protein
MRHINIYVIITIEMAILKISCNLSFNWVGGGRNPPANVSLKIQLTVNALTFI